MPRTRPILLVLLVSALAWLTATGTAQAHTSLSSSSPAEGSTVTDALSVVTLTFSGGVRGPEVTVTGPDGALVSTAPATDEGSTVTVPVAPTATGAHTVSWVVTSADGHELTGTVGFDYAGPVATVPAPVPTSAPASATGSASASGSPSASGSAPASGSAAATGPVAAEPSEAAAEQPEDGPNLVVRGLLVLVVLGTAAGGWLLLRRRRAGRP